MNTASKGEMRRAGFTPNVEVQRFAEFIYIVVGCNKIRENESPLRENKILIGDLFARIASGAAYRTEITHDFFRCL